MQRGSALGSLARSLAHSFARGTSPRLLPEAALPPPPLTHRLLAHPPRAKGFTREARGLPCGELDASGAARGGVGSVAGAVSEAAQVAERVRQALRLVAAGGGAAGVRPHVAAHLCRGDRGGAAAGQAGVVAAAQQLAQPVTAGKTKGAQRLSGRRRAEVQPGCAGGMGMQQLHRLAAQNCKAAGLTLASHHAGERPASRRPGNGGRSRPAGCERSRPQQQQLPAAAGVTGQQPSSPDDGSVDAGCLGGWGGACKEGVRRAEDAA